MDIRNRASRTSTERYTLGKPWTPGHSSVGDHVPHYHESISARYLDEDVGGGARTWSSTDPNSFDHLRIAVKELRRLAGWLEAGLRGGEGRAELRAEQEELDGTISVRSRANVCPSFFDQGCRF